MNVKVIALALLAPLLMGAEGSCQEPESGPVPCEGRPCPAGDPKPERGTVSILYQVSLRPERGPQDLTITWTASGGGRVPPHRSVVDKLWLRDVPDIRRGTNVEMMVERGAVGGPIICAVYRMKPGSLELIAEKKIDENSANDCYVHGVA